MANTFHATAQSGFIEEQYSLFARRLAGSHYHQFRPTYTDELVDHVIANLYTGACDGAKYDVVEIGAGTGKFTNKITAGLQKGFRYLATEPSDGFVATLKEQSPDVDTAVCVAADIPLRNNSVKNIICAQSFHWFATTESLREMTRVLTPNGRLIMVWNNKEWAVPWFRAMEEVLTQYFGDTPRAENRSWHTVIEAFPALSLVEHSFLDGITNMKGPKDFVVSHFSSISVIASLDDHTKAEALAKFRGVLDKHFPDECEIVMQFVSEFYCVEKKHQTL